MEQKYLDNYKNNERAVSLLNVVAVVLAITAFTIGKKYFVYLMSLALTLLLIALVIVMHYVYNDKEEKDESVFYHLIGLHLILTVCSLFTSARVSDFNSFSYVFIHSLLIGLLVLIAIQIIFKEKKLLISVLAFVSAFVLALFEVNTVLNIALALVMGVVIFSALTKLMKPAGIYALVFGIINLIISVVMLLKPMGIIGFYGHIIVNFVIITLFYVLPALIKNIKVEDKKEVKEEVVAVKEEKTEDKEKITEDKDLQNRNRWVIKKYNSLPLDELMKSPVNALWGVSDGDAELLKKAFNIKTVEDLATNKFFNWAREIVEEAEKD
ncbi:MAG: hypothetical protein ACOX1F_01330 [Erysipelotrichaceae bacterium]|jgi:hypothetical protein